MTKLEQILQQGSAITWMKLAAGHPSADMVGTIGNFIGRAGEWGARAAGKVVGKSGDLGEAVAQGAGLNPQVGRFVGKAIPVAAAATAAGATPMGRRVRAKIEQGTGLPVAPSNFGMKPGDVPPGMGYGY